MATTEQPFNLVQTSATTWIAVHVDRDKLAAVSAGQEPPPQQPRSAGSSNSGGLFAYAASARVVFGERFPRLAIALIALVIFAASITVEIEYLQQAGYSWHR